jgi:hypothetical protein
MKPEAEMAQALLRTRASVSLLRCAGMRSITAVTLRLDQFTKAGDGCTVPSRHYASLKHRP